MKAIWVALVAAWLFVLFLYGLGRRDLWNSHEARAAMNAQSVLAGDWLLPTLNDGTPELQKPPLYYWLTAATATLTGEVDAFSVRLPAALAGVACLGVLVWWGRSVGRPYEGLLAALLLATALHFTWLARVARIDVPLTFTTSVALVGLYLNRPRTKLLAYVSLGCSVLLKGPVGLVLVGAALTVFYLWERQWPRGLGWWWGVPLILAIALPWFLAVDRQTDGELGRIFFWHHNVARGLGGSTLRGHPWWFYGPRFVVDFAPWSLLFPPCLIWFWHHGREDRAARFGLAWVVGMLLVLSLVRYKRADYLVPAYPGAALFLACVLRSSPLWSVLKEAKAAKTAVLQIMLASAVAWWVRVEVFLPQVEVQREQRPFASLIRQHAPRPEPIHFFHMEAHALAFHLGQPLHSLRFWHEVDALPNAAHVVIPLRQAAEHSRQLHAVSLIEVERNHAGHEKPMVLFRVSRRSPTTTTCQTSPN